MLPFRVISLHGAPRSGTSWLGKIFDSHPDVAYRFQPLFSFRFKEALDTHSTVAEVLSFLSALYSTTDDEFILQRRQQERGVHPAHPVKYLKPNVLVIKEVRYHYVIPVLLQHFPGIRIVGIVRHPCGAINSWLKTPREFRPEWDPAREWRTAPSKNQGRRGEYYGFERWKELASSFLALERERPDAFRLVRYERLVHSPETETDALFAFCGLELHPQVLQFLTASHAREVEDPDTVFRTPDVADRWKSELDPEIRDAVFRELAKTPLSTFLE